MTHCIETEIERGHPRAKLGLALRALDALDLCLDAIVTKSKKGEA